MLEWRGLLLTDPTFDPPDGVYQAGPVTLRKLAGPAVSTESLSLTLCCSVTTIISTIWIMRGC